MTTLGCSPHPNKQTHMDALYGRIAYIFEGTRKSATCIMCMSCYV